MDDLERAVENGLAVEDVTRWVRGGCARTLVEERGMDAVVFTSMAEAELAELGLDWRDLREMWPSLVVAAHGPITTSGAVRLGVSVDVVSSRFGTFEVSGREPLVLRLDFSVSALPSDLHPQRHCRLSAHHHQRINICNIASKYGPNKS